MILENVIALKSIKIRIFKDNKFPTEDSDGKVTLLIDIAEDAPVREMEGQDSFRNYMEETVMP